MGRPLLLQIAAALSAVGLLGASCDRRVEEPPPREVRPSDAAPQGPAERVLAPLGDAARCVKPSPPTPERVAPKSPDPRCPPDPETPPTLRMGKVVFDGPKGATVDVEITESDKDRQRGLMYRTSMPEGRGMIFRFEEKADHSFWMRNTCISLDMLYLDDDGTIVGIQENTPTISDETFSVGCPSRYVLELNAGWSRRHGVAAGQRVKLEGI